MSLLEIVGKAKEDIEQGAAWLSKVVEEHVPALLAEAEKVQGNPIVQALEGLVLPPEVEQEIVRVIAAFAAVLAKVPAEPATPAAPEAPVAEQPPADVQSAA